MALSFVKVSAKGMTNTTKIFSFNFTMVRHLHHGIHVKVRQLKVTEHVMAF